MPHVKPRLSAGRRGALAALVLGATLAAPDARAQNDQRAPEFEQGLRLIEEGRYAEACAAFKQAEAAGKTVKTRFQLGRCHEAQGKYARARGYFLEASQLAQAAGDKERAQAAEARARDNEPKVAKLVVSVPSKHEAPGLAITLDGVPFPRELWNQVAIVDPGPHTLHVTAPGLSGWSHEIPNAPSGGDAVQVAVPPLVAPTPGPVLAPPTPDTAADGGATKMRSAALFWTGLGATAAGAAAIVVTSITLVDCGPSCVDSPPAGYIAGFALGGAGVLGGIPLMIIFGRQVPAEEPLPAAPPTAWMVPRITPRAAGAVLAGRF